MSHPFKALAAIRTTPSEKSHEMHSGSSLRTIDISKIARPLRLVSLADYFLLIIGINGALHVVIVGITDGRLSTVTVMLIFGLAYGYCTLIGWRGVGVLGIVRTRRKVLALLILSAVCSFSAMTSIPKLGSADIPEQEAAFFEIAEDGFIVLTSFAAIMALAYLRRAIIPQLSLKLMTFLKEGFLNQPNPKLRLPPKSPWKGLACLAGGILWLAAFDLIPERFFFENSGTTRLLQLSSIGYVILVYARQFFQPDFKTTTSNDKRPPVIFLRSFMDDETLESKDLSNAESTFFGFSLESRLAAHLSRFGPFIAVGSPKDKNPHLGAIRVRLTDEEWQDVVMRWIKESVLVVMIAGGTEWASWELHKILEFGQTGKLLMLFPHIKMTKWWKVWEIWRNDPGAEMRLIRIQGAFTGTIWESGMLQLPKAETIRSLVFDPEGCVTVITSKPRNMDSHHLAGLLGHHLMANRSNDLVSFAGPPRKSKHIWAAASLIFLVTVISGLFLVTNYGHILAPPLPKALPADIPVTSTGSLLAGGFDYLDAKNVALWSPVFHPGDTVSLAYYVTGFRLDSSGKADVISETTLLNADGAPSSDTTKARFNQVIGSSDQIRFTYRMKLFKEAKSGDHRINIKLHDTVSGADFEFRPLMRIEATPK